MLFQNATLCDHQGIREADLRVENGVIADIGTLLPKPNEEIYNAKGKLLLPAMIDLNITPKARNLSHKALLSLSHKALKGGVGSVLLSPYTQPACDQSGSIELIKSIDKDTALTILPSIAPSSISTYELDSEISESKLSDVATLHAHGGKAIFAKSDMPSHLFLRLAQYAQMLKIPFVCFCQDRNLADGAMNEGLLSTKLGLAPIPPFSQSKEVAKCVEMLRGLNFLETHTESSLEVILSTLYLSRDFEILAALKPLDDTHKVRFYPEVSIHHLALDESLCEGYNTAAKLNPPLVSKNEQNALIECLKNGKIHLLTSLQSADSQAKKDQVFELASFGVDSLEYYFSLLYTFLHKRHNIPLELISTLTSLNPAKILKRNVGSLEPGADADLILCNPNESFVVNDTFSPYFGQSLQGKVVAAFYKKCGFVDLSDTNTSL